MSTPRLVEPQKSARAAGPRRPHDECPRPWRLLALSSSRRKLVEPEEVGRVEDEHLAHHVRVLLIAAHEPDHPSTGRTLITASKRSRISSQGCSWGLLGTSR